MNYGELSRYIDDLKQSGFDTQTPRPSSSTRKIADPLTTLVMAILAVPFALSMGKRGGLVGIATAIGLAIAYWIVAGVFGRYGQRQHAARLPRRMVSRSPLWHYRNLPLPQISRHKFVQFLSSPPKLQSSRN